MDPKHTNHPHHPKNLARFVLSTLLDAGPDGISAHKLFDLVWEQEADLTTMMSLMLSMKNNPLFQIKEDEDTNKVTIGLTEIGLLTAIAASDRKPSKSIIFRTSHCGQRVVEVDGKMIAGNLYDRIVAALTCENLQLAYELLASTDVIPKEPTDDRNYLHVALEVIHDHPTKSPLS